MSTRFLLRLLCGVFALGGLLFATTNVANADAPPRASDGPATRTPIKHLVVLFQENVPFDHYFGPIHTLPTCPASRRS